MNVGLIECTPSPCHTKGQYYMPLGLLSIAAMVEYSGHNIAILELQDWLESQNELRNDAMQSSAFAATIAGCGFDVLGFTTRCDNLPYVLDVAKHCKGLQKDATIVLGGPGTSFCDMQILDAFPYIDIVVRGEGEQTVAELLTRLDHDAEMEKVKGITYRHSASSIRRNADRHHMTDLGTLPPLPFHLLDAKLRRADHTWTNVEAGRGCPQMCGFCSTCLFWGRPSRMRPAQRIVSDMKLLHERYDYSLFTLIHDNILSNRSQFHELCDLMHQQLPDVRWSVSASLNLTTPRTVEKMQKCGCAQVFVGIESVSRHGAANIATKALEPEEIRRRLELYRRHQIRTRNSYIIGFPDEAPEDINQTLQFAVETQATSTYELPDEIQIHPLCLHPGTSLYQKYQDRLSWVNPGSDLADPVLGRMDSCLQLARRHPTVFTAYASHLPADRYAEVLQLCTFFSLAATVFPKTLSVAMAELKLPPIEFCESLQARSRDIAEIPRRQIPTSGSAAKAVLRSFPQVLREICLERGYSGPWIELFLDYESPRLIPVLRPRPRDPDMDHHKTIRLNHFVDLTASIPPTTATRTFPHDMEELFQAYRRSAALTDVARRTTRVFYYSPRGCWRDAESIVFAMKTIDALSAVILQRIDARRTCGEIVNDILESFPRSRKTQLNDVVLCRALGQMAGLGLIRLMGKTRTVLGIHDERQLTRQES